MRRRMCDRPVWPLSLDGDHSTCLVADSVDRVLEYHPAALVYDQFVAALPHHSRAEPGVLELLDQAGDLLLVSTGQ